MSSVWTRNYSNMLACGFGSADTISPSNSASYATGNISIRNPNGSYQRCAGTYGVGGKLMSMPTLSNVVYGISNISTGYYALQLGSGTTEPDYNDYALESPLGSFVMSQANVGVETLVYDDTSHTYRSTRRFVLQYTGSSEISVTEVGIFFNANYSSPSQPSLIYHEVFDTAITLNQYESVVIELTQSFPLINYEPYPE